MKKQGTKQPRARKPSSQSSGLTFTAHPLSGIDPADMKAGLLEIARQQEADFPRHLQAIMNLFRAAYPPQMLATLAAYGLYAAVGPDGIAPRTMLAQIQQHHVEVLQALLLSLLHEEWGTAPATPADIQKLIDSVTQLARAFLQRRFLATETERDLQERMVLGLQERMRGHTQMIRNWGYFAEVVRISADLYGALDEGFMAHHGFGATDLIRVMHVLGETVEARHNERFVTLKRIFRERTVEKLVRAYYAHYPGVAGDPSDFLKHVPAEATLDQIKHRLLAHADIWLVTYGVVAVEDLAARTGIARDEIEKILSVVSMRPGDLAGHNPEHLFLANPIWTAPGVEVAGEFYFPMPQMVFSHIHDVMRALAERAGVRDKLEKRRAQYLEQALCSVLTRALPAARIVPKAVWHWQGARFETDALAILDRTVLIFEAKGAALTPLGLRGAPERVKRHVQELIVEPSVQSTRLEQIIWGAKAADNEALAATNRLGIDAANVDTVIRVSVTLDDFSALSSAEAELKEAGWVPADLQLAATLNIADLGCVADLLDEPIPFIHYFREKSRIQKATKIFGDELDYLGFYLETAFQLPDQEGENYQLVITGMSAAVDRFYVNRDAGIVTKKPRVKLQTYFHSLLAALQDRRQPGWTTIGLELLNFGSFEHQRKIVRELEKLRKTVARTYRDPKHTCAVVYIPVAREAPVFLFFVYPEALRSDRKRAVSELASNALATSGRERCVIVGRMIERWERPYEFVGFAADAATQGA